MNESGNNYILQEDLDLIAEDSIISDLKECSVLVTGATGLVGSMLVRSLLCCNRLKGYGIKVYALIRNREKAEKIFGEMLNREDFTIVEGDVCCKPEISVSVDYIIHCASVTASKTMISCPVETIKTSLEGTMNILEFAREKNVRSFVYISSMEMYGKFDTVSGDVTEDVLGYIDPLALRSNYPESKRMCENMCIAFLNQHGVHTRIARLAQTFGPGILPGENRVFAQFARCAIANNDIVLHTAGNSEGNYCYLRDAVKGILYIMLKGKDGEAYNVSNPSTHTTIKNMAHMVCDKIAEGKINVVFDIPETNSFGYAADTKMKLSSEKLTGLGWKPEVGLEESYVRLIESMNTGE